MPGEDRSGEVEGERGPGEGSQDAAVPGRRDAGKAAEEGPDAGEPEVLEGLARDIVSRLATTLFSDDDVPLWQRAGAGAGEAEERVPGGEKLSGPGTVPAGSGVSPAGSGPGGEAGLSSWPDRAEARSGDPAAVPSARPGLWSRPLRPRQPSQGRPALLVRGTVRSGRHIRHSGDVVVLGDVNPGGQVVASGDVVVMGTLRGMVHAGATGDYGAVVAAFRLSPTQLRIASYVARPPEEPGGHPEYPEMALVKDGVVVVAPLTTGTLARFGTDEVRPTKEGGGHL